MAESKKRPIHHHQRKSIKGNSPFRQRPGGVGGHRQRPTDYVPTPGSDDLDSIREQELRQERGETSSPEDYDRDLKRRKKGREAA